MTRPKIAYETDASNDPSHPRQSYRPYGLGELQNADATHDRVYAPHRLEKPVGAVGNHTMTHPFLPALPRAEMVQQIAGAKALIEHVAAQPVVLFRPPYEGRTPAIEH